MYVLNLKLVVGMYVLFPGDPSISTVTYYMNTDPLLALVPTVLLNLASTRFPAIIEKLRINCGVPTKK